jgi:hypothetical protein
MKSCEPRASQLFFWQHFHLQTPEFRLSHLHRPLQKVLLILFQFFSQLPLPSDLGLHTFDKIAKASYGRLIYIGTDEFGAKVYTLCRMRSKRFVVPAISDLKGQLLQKEFWMVIQKWHIWLNQRKSI